MTHRSARAYLTAIALLLAATLGWYAYSFLTQPVPAPTDFNGLRAYEDVTTQVAFGPRAPGSEGHARIREWMRDELESAGWEVEVQISERLGNPIYNLVATRGEANPQIIVGAHYDTRIFADAAVQIICDSAVAGCIVE